jgi:uncharacterized damage-inducible protein DinB
MNAQLEKSFNNLASAQQEFRQKLAPFTGERARFKPNGTEWSAIQVLQHVIDAEKRTFASVRHRLKSATTADKAGILSHIKFAFMKYVMKTNRRFKMPQGLTQPNGEQSLDELKQEWADYRDKWKNYLEGVKEEKLPVVALDHPVFGSFNLIQSLEFVAVHARHHMYQLQRIKEHPDFENISPRTKKPKQE